MAAAGSAARGGVALARGSRAARTAVAPLDGQRPARGEFPSAPAATARARVAGSPLALAVGTVRAGGHGAELAECGVGVLLRPRLRALRPDEAATGREEGQVDLGAGGGATIGYSAAAVGLLRRKGRAGVAARAGRL